MAWVLWLLAIATIAVTGLAATGAFGEMAEDDELSGAGPDRIPLALFGYRKDVVDRLLESANKSDSDQPHQS